MQRIVSFCRAHREALAYLFFGAVTSLTNMLVYFLLKWQVGLGTSLSNALGLAVSILVAYVTNRRWVFFSRTRGWAALREFAVFVLCRLGTAVLDQAMVVFGVDHVVQTILPEKWWEALVKLTAMAVVILLNYVFSKTMIFRRAK